MTSCLWADSEESRNALPTTISSLHNLHLPMAQDINTECNAEIENLAVEVANVAVKQIDFFCESVNMKYQN